MVARGIFGLKDGVYGGWISKPGFDVFSASPGQFMLDTDTQVFQTVLKGTTNLLTLAGTGSNVPAGYVATQNIPLPSEFAAYSNLIVNAVYSRRINGVTSDEASIVSSTYLKWRTGGGVLTLSGVFTQPAGNSNITSDTYAYDANWSIFRAQF